MRHSSPPPNKRLQRTGISVPLIDNLAHNAVVARPLKRGVGLLLPVGNEKKHLHAYAARWYGLLSYCAGHRRHGTCAAVTSDECVER